LGVCSAYVDVITETIHGFLHESAPVIWLRLGLFSVLCVISLTRGLSNLAWLSAIALIVYTFVIYALIKYGILALSEGAVMSLAEAFANPRWQGLGKFLGSAIFAFEGVSLAPYVYDSMRLDRPNTFLLVLVAANTIAFLVYGFVGVFGFIAYGDDVEDVIYLNFPEGSLDVRLVEIVLCVVLLLTFVLQMFPVFSCAEALCLGARPDEHEDQELDKEEADAPQDPHGFAEAHVLGRHASWSATDGAVGEVELEDLSDNARGRPGARSSVPSEPEPSTSAEKDSTSTSGASELRRQIRASLLPVLLRWLVVLLTFVLAAVIPKVSDVTSIAGAFALGSIGFVFPGLAHMKINCDRLTPLQGLSDILLVAVGIAAMVFTVTERER